MKPATKIHVKSAVPQRSNVAAEQPGAGAALRCKSLSFAQQRLWFLDQLEPNSPLYNIAVMARLEGTLNVKALEAAFNAIITRHEALRTRFVCPDETPFQAIDACLEIQLQFADLSCCSQGDRERELQLRIREEINRPFDLSGEPLLRVFLFRLQPGEHRLLLVLHHIVADEWSLRVLFSELSAFYAGEVQGRPILLPSLPIQYADYADWQREWLRSKALQGQIEYWKRQLGGSPPLTELPADYARRPAPSFNGSNVRRTFNPQLAGRLQELAQRHDSTLFMVLLAGFKTLLHRYTQQEDLVVCTPIAGRSRLETESLIGFFVNTLPLRTNLAGDPTFEELLGRVREVTLGAYDHQDVPFEKLVEELRPERSLNHMPFSRVMFGVQHNLFEQVRFAGLTVEFLDINAEKSKFDATLVIQDHHRGLRAHLEYSSELFEVATAERLMRHFEALLEGIVTNPGARLSELPLLSSEERHQILVEWNDTSTEYPRDKTIQEVFETRLESAPEAVALRFGQNIVSYRELNARANQLAHYLKRFKVGADVPVGLCMLRSADMVVGLLAILKAGGAYVPLDPAYPKERLAFMLEDTQAPVVLAQQELISVLPRNAAKLVWLDTDWELIARESRQNPVVETSPDSLAYVMYTSGSTGRPKGVAVPHRAVNRLVLNSNYIRLDASDRIAQVSNVSFDASTFEIWGTLLNGAELVGITSDVALSPRDFAHELRERGITAMFLTSALFSQLAGEVPGAFETLRTLIAGGEALDPKWVRAVLKNRPPGRLLNGYGPTENTTFTCCHLIESLSENATNVPIGRPIANTQVYILDPHLNPVPLGVVGELYVGGDGLARGYWNRPELTAEKFVPNPFGQEGPSFLYRTGDLGRFLCDGTIEFLGRMDNQVKIRGFRIELGEIETVLGQHPAVRECVVVGVGQTTATRRLVAYVVAKDQQSPTASELRLFLAQRLPDYMMPSVFVPMRALPLTPNGKIDRLALPAPDQIRPDLEKKYAGPRDEVERQLVTIWERVLEVSPIGIQDKFFDLGGHSLLAVRVVAQIEKVVGKKLRLSTIFQAPTIEQLAAIIRGEVKETSVTCQTSLVEIQAQGTRPPLYLVHGAGGGMFWGYVNLSRFLGPDQPVYAFKSRGLDGREELSRIEALAAQYIADLQAKQPCGPYYLAGYCFGGNVAFEMARQLVAQNQKVAFLGLFNCAPPNSPYNQIPWTPRWALRFIGNLLYWGKYFRQWSPTQRREFFRWKAFLLKRKLVCCFRRTGEIPKNVDAGEMVDLSAYTEDQRKIWEAHIRGLVNFHPQTYSGKVHLFRSPGHPFWCSFDPDYGWRDLATGGVATEIVPGAHEKILEEPCVKIVASKLRLILERVQSQDSLTPVSGPTPAAPAVDELQTDPRVPAEPTVAAQEVLDRKKKLSRDKSEPGSFITECANYAEAFEAQARHTPTALAACFEGKNLTYAELDARANQLGRYLQELGVGPEVLVGVCLERSLDMLVSLLAVFKAGGAYLPLDSSYPSERLSYMLKESQAPVLITQSKLLPVFSAAPLRLLCLDAPDEQVRVERYPQTPFACPAARQNLAYVIFTSGSTGTPKGVEIPYGALLSHNWAVLRAYQLRPTDRVLQFTPLSFDISVEEIFPTWLCGAALVLRSEAAISSPARFLDFIVGERLNVLNIPTAYWHELVEFLDSDGKRLPDPLRLMIVGGEKASDQVFRRWKRVCGSATLINSYGATEATVTTTCYTARPTDEALLIGQPLANSQVIVLDDAYRPVPPGSAGELYIGGEGLARGYLHNPELTVQKFIHNPCPDSVGSTRLYRTGDRVRLQVDGNLEFIGRSDNQVKIRGYRIELGEVEVALREHSKLKEAVVCVNEDAQGKRRLVAYVVAREASGPDTTELVDFLSRKLPRYMIPSVFVPLASLPITAAGKVDRKALPAPDKTRPLLGRKFVPAHNDLERKLAQVWSEVLGLNDVGIHDNFFELGGHSLLAIQAISRLRDGLHLEISLEDFYGRGTIAALADYLGGLTGAMAPPLDRSSTFQVQQHPLTETQRRIWFLDHFETGLSPYTRSVAIRLKGNLNVPAMEQSLSQLSRWQEALRAVFPAETGHPSQYIAEPEPIVLQVIDLSRSQKADREAQALNLANEEARRRDIGSHRLLRPLLLKFADNEHWLVLILHEIAVDSCSIRVLLQHLPCLYAAAAEGRVHALPTLPVNYLQAMQAVESLSPEQETQHLEFWKKQLSQAPELLELPCDRPRPAKGSAAGGRHLLQLPQKEISELAASCSQPPSDLEILIATFATLLHRYTGAKDIVIGSVVSARQKPEWNALVGNFEKPVPLRCDLSGDPSFRELLRRVGVVHKEAMAHHSLSFASLVDHLHPSRNASYTPVFQVMIRLEDEELPASEAAGLVFDPAELNGQTSKYDLTLRLAQTPAGLSGWIEYSTALFEPDRIARMADHFTMLLQAAAGRPDERISVLPLLTAPERQLLLAWNATTNECPAEGTLVDLFEQQAARTPDAVALVSGSTRLTYAQLATRMKQVASQLEVLGVGNESLVGIYLERSADLVAAILGVLRAGAAYVPLDPAYPAERLAFISKDAQLRVIVTQSKLTGALQNEGAAVLCLDKVEPPRSRMIAARGKPNNNSLAYVIYTSGSTGQPKGVALEHRGAVALVNWAKTVFTPQELSGVLASTSVCFDLSVFEIFVPLSWGGKVIMADNALALSNLPAREEVTFINTVPSAIRELLRLNAVPPSVQVVNLAGEPLSTELVDQIYQQTAARKVYDLYGPTETTTYSTFALRQPGKPATIGRPLTGEEVHLLDPNLQLVPIGIPGELYIGGVGVARGYLNRPELTAQKFIAHPFKDGERLYRSGDLARWRADGNLEYLGRLDHQVKIRGFRIELGEIEAVLKTQPGVREAIVLAREDHPGEKRLVAYVVSESTTEISADALRGKMRDVLPEYMLPSAFVFLDSLPLTPNGKVDRKALPAPDAQAHLSQKLFIAPRNPIEEKLATLWQEVLHLNQVSVDQNFFELGGHSLTAIRLLSRIRELFKAELPLSSIFTCPTIAAFADALASGQWTRNRTPMLPIEPAPREGKVAVSFVQERLWFLDQLEPGSHAYNIPVALRLRGELNTSALEQAINTIVARHETLRASFRYSEGTLEQVIAAACQLKLDITELPPGAEQLEQAQHLVNQQARRPFDLSRSPLVRASLIRLGSADHVFLLVMHHTISDGWSLALFFQELSALYEELIGGNAVARLPELSLQYADFAHWERQWMQGRVLEHELDFWRETLSGAPTELSLPTDRPIPEQPTRRAERRSIQLGQPIQEYMAQLGRAEGCTPFIILMTALQLTLHKWAGNEDLVVGTVIAGRNQRQLEHLIGCFMNFLPIRAKIVGAQTGKQLLQRVRTAVVESQSHQECPFEKIVETINPRRRLNQNPLYNVALLLQNFPAQLFASEKIQASTFTVSMQAALLDLRFEAEHTPEGLEFACEYKTDLFEPRTIDELLASFKQVLELLSRVPDASLGQFRLTQGLEAQAQAAREREQAARMRIAGTFTCEPVAEPLAFWLKKLQEQAAVEFAPYNQVFQQLLDPHSLLSGNRRGLNVLLIRLEDWLSQPDPGEDGRGTSRCKLERAAADFVAALKGAAARTSTPWLVCFCPPSTRGCAEALGAQFLDRLEESLSQQLSGVSGVYMLTSAELAKWYPVADYYDATAEELGHVPYTPVFFTALGTAIARKFHALSRLPHKVIVLDCDQTLWSGVCGEDGPKGIKLDAARLALQRFMRAQHEAGMLLCMCSKNNESDVLEVFVQRLDMPLQREHFTAYRLNWKPKSENLKSLAKELGLALDSFIFIDDNPVECAEVEANCPEVVTLQLPENTALIAQFLEHCWVFDHLMITEEDRRRAERYRQNQQREKLRSEAPSLADFLAGLELKVSIEAVSQEQWPRVAQLTQRTNQFNFTTHRFTEGELAKIHSRCTVVTVQVKDRFGDYGLVGVIIYERRQQALEVDSFLLSCRVLGRGVEHQMLARLGELARKDGAAWVDIHFTRTEKNKPAWDFLESVGSHFKQPLNGGFLFRFPAGFASEVTFQPCAPETEPISAVNGGKSRVLTSSTRTRRFASYRTIALEANDAGAIDRQMQAATVVRIAKRPAFVAPQNELERNLCALWANLLHVEKVGLQDDFFELGGHSLLAVRLFAEIEKLTGRKFPLVTVFQAPTVGQLARVLAQQGSAATPSLVVPIRPEGSRPPLFLIHGAGGDVLWGYANLAQHLPSQQPIFGIKSRGQAGLNEYPCLEEMARFYLEVVKQCQPQGPYYLGGYCFGGNVAYEMARQLEQQGEQVALVALLDSAPANAGYESFTWWRPKFLWRFSRNLSYWLQDFAALPPRDRQSFFKRKTRAFLRKIFRRIRGSEASSMVDIEEVIDPSHIPAQELELWQIHLQALTKHVEQPYAGEVVLLRTRGQPLFCSLEEDFCWGNLTRDGVKVILVPGSHESVFVEPNVQCLAKELDLCLLQAQARAGQVFESKL